MPDEPTFLSTLAPAAADRRAARGVLLALAALFLAAAPFARVAVMPVPAFLPAYQAALVVCDAVTAVLLFGQYAMLRTRAVLVLAAGYVFAGAMAVLHALSFPGLFAPTGLLGAGPQTTAWLYFLWHAGFPLFVLGYARLKHGVVDANDPRRAIAYAVAAALALAGALALLATRGHDLLPPIMSGNADAPVKVLVATATWLVGVVALLVSWRRRPHTVLDLWLMVVLVAWAADSALAAVLNSARFDVGWYAGRACGLAASAFVLAVLLLENGRLYARVAEANAQLQAANRDLSRFAGALAHDLQQPILAIMGYSQHLQRRGIPPGDSKMLAKIVRNSQQADRMIQAMLQFARLGQRDLMQEPVDLNTVCDEARGALSLEIEARSVDCRVGPLPVVQGDAAMLELAFVNLLSNAIKYSRGSDRPTVEVESEREADGTQVVRVRDNGVGFDMAHASRLFAPFERLHATEEFEGTGMGLANVRRIMERHGGTIRAEAAPGRGATFTLVFPG